jgi:cell division protease FtsH
VIDFEVKSIVEEQFTRVRLLLEEHREDMDRVVRELLTRETLSGEDFQTLLEGGELPEEEIPRREPPKEKPEPGFMPPTVLPKPGRA